VIAWADECELPCAGTRLGAPPATPQADSAGSTNIVSINTPTWSSQSNLPDKKGRRRQVAKLKLTWHSWCIDKIHNVQLKGILLACIAVTGQDVAEIECVPQWSRLMLLYAASVSEGGLGPQTPTVKDSSAWWPETVGLCCRLWPPSAAVFHSWCLGAMPPCRR